MDQEQQMKPQPQQPDDGQQEADEVPAAELCPDCWREKCCCPPEPSYSEVCRGIR